MAVIFSLNRLLAVLPYCSNGLKNSIGGSAWSGAAGVGGFPHVPAGESLAWTAISESGLGEHALQILALSLVAFVSLLAFASGSPACAGDESDAGDKLSTLADDLRGELGLPGLIIGFQQGVHPEHFLASGVRRLGGNSQIDVNDRMHMGSVSKPLSATVIADLIAGGHLDWDTRLFDVFPELTGKAHLAYRAVTVWDLLSHKARFIPFEDDDEVAKAPRFAGTAREIRSKFLAWAVTQEPQIVPEGEEPYSNAGYAVLAALAERVMNKDFESLVRERLFKRLKLDRAGFGWPASSDPNSPWGHRFVDRKFQPHPPNDQYQLGPVFAAAGDMHMSVPNLMRFGQAHMAALEGVDGAFSSSVIRRLHRTETGYGGGWYIRPTGHYHTGSAETFFAAIVVSPARKTVIAIATNGSNPENDFALAGKVMGRVYKAYGVLKKNDEDGVPVKASE